MTLDRRRRLVRLLLVVATTGLALPGSASAGAESRGGPGRFYLQLAYGLGEADRGFDDHGSRVSLADPAFLDSVTALFATGEADYQESGFQLYAEIGLLEDLDAILSVAWKDIEKSFELGAFGLTTTVEQESSGFGDVDLGLAWNALDVPLPVAFTGSLRLPTYSTSVSDLNLETIDSRDDEIPLGQGTVDLTLGVSASSGPLLPFGFVHASVAYVVSDLEAREFSDRISWSAKVGASYRGFGGAIFAYGLESLENGDAPSTISQDFFFDPADRVTVLNDQEWLTVGAQLWYSWGPLGIQVSYASTIAGRNTVDTDRLSAGIFVQR